MSKKHSHYIQLDLIVILLLFIVVSVLAIYNAQQLGQYPGQNFALKQVIYFAIGIICIITLQFVDLDQLSRVSLYLYLFGVFLLVLLEFSPASLAEPVNNAKRMFNRLPGVSLQPSEFAKLGLIVYLATVINKHRLKFERATIRTDLLLCLKIAVLTVIPVFFILKQPDLGTSLVFMFVAGMMLILSGINWKLLGTLILGGGIAVSLSLLLIVNFPEMSNKLLGIKPYQIERVMTWFDPTQQVSDDTFHIDRSLQAVGSGQLTGKGMKSLQVHLPEAHTDFIFSVIGESFGFIGSALVVFLFFLLIYRLVTLGMKSYEFNPFAANFCFGYMSLILIHTVQNIGMTIGILPITGIPLLFISYGGSTILSTVIGLGIVYRIAVESSRQDDFLFK